MDIITSPILQLKELKLNETKYLLPCHTARIRKIPVFRTTKPHCLLSFSYPSFAQSRPCLQTFT